MIDGFRYDVLIKIKSIVRRKTMRRTNTIYDVFDDLFAGFNPIKVIEDMYGLNQAPRQIRELSAGSFPPADVYVTPSKDLVIEVALAGVNQDQVKLDLEGRTLVLDVDRSLKEGEADPKDGWYKLQAGIKGFTTLKTTYTIPRQYDLTKVNAKLEHGLLTIVINPTEETKRLDEKRNIPLIAA